MAPKAMASGADIVCFELEDAIAPQHKKLARETVVDWFEREGADAVANNAQCELVVRVNCLRSIEGIADLHAIMSSSFPPPTIMLPKVSSKEDVHVVDALLSEQGLPTRLHVIIETNDGLEAAYEIAKSSPRIDALFFGGVDMAADLRCQYSWENLVYARSRVVHAAAGAMLDVLDVPFLDLNDEAGLMEESTRSWGLGFGGKGAIHPKQIAAINSIFTPSEEAVARARKVVAAFEAADSGLVVVDGKLIEKPVLREMYRVLASVGE
jgi:citrate lyase beta subunit